jgi:CheY-like chemotaxis protein
MSSHWRRMEQLRGMHVLVIDNDQLTRHFLRSVLEFSGAIVTAADTTEAIRAALIADVIVCDFASAEKAGSDFVPQLQQLHVRLDRAVPIIALVPAGTRNAHVRPVGFHVHLTKPVDGDELRAAVLQVARPTSADAG